MSDLVKCSCVGNENCSRCGGSGSYRTGSLSNSYRAPKKTKHISSPQSVTVGPASQPKAGPARKPKAKKQERLFGCAHCGFSGTHNALIEHRHIDHPQLFRVKRKPAETKSPQKGHSLQPQKPLPKQLKKGAKGLPQAVGRKKQAKSAASSQLRNQLIVQGIIAPVSESSRRQKARQNEAGKRSRNAANTALRTCAICDQPYKFGEFVKHLTAVCRIEAIKRMESTAREEAIQKPKPTKQTIPGPDAPESNELQQKLDNLFNAVSQRKLERQMKQIRNNG